MNKQTYVKLIWTMLIKQCSNCCRYKLIISCPKIGESWPPKSVTRLVQQCTICYTKIEGDKCRRWSTEFLHYWTEHKLINNCGNDCSMVLLDDGNLGDTIITENTDLIRNKIPESRDMVLSYLHIDYYKYRIQSTKT